MILRSLLIQATWNTRTMIGHGFAYALKPLLWWLHPDLETRRAALARHVDHFNSHPYLATLALGAVARLELDGADPDHVRRFKTAARGPLGGLGDRLIWVGWLPTVALSCVALALAGVSGAVVAMTFVLIFNSGHVALRLWGWRAGFESGVQLAPTIRSAGLEPKAEALTKVCAVMLGLVLGLMFTAGIGAGLAPWLPLGVVAFIVGDRGRRRGWRPVVYLTMATIGLVAVAGLLMAG